MDGVPTSIQTSNLQNVRRITALASLLCWFKMAEVFLYYNMSWNESIITQETVLITDMQRRKHSILICACSNDIRDKLSQVKDNAGIA